MRGGGDGVFSCEALVAVESVRRLKGATPSKSAMVSLNYFAQVSEQVRGLVDVLENTEPNPVQAQLVEEAKLTASQVAVELGMARVAVMEIMQGCPCEVSPQFQGF